MTAEEIVDACEKRGIKLRINPEDGKLTAIPRRKVPQELLVEMRTKRAELIEFIEDRDGGGEPLTVDDLPPPEPKPPSVAEQLIARAWNEFKIRIELDQPSATGMIKVTTPWMKRLVPDPNDPEHGDPEKGLPWIEVPPIEVSDLLTGAKMPDQDYCAQQRGQVPLVLAALINNCRTELLAHLRAPYLPPAPEAPADADPAKRSIWERMARPDDMIPGMRDNQKRIKQLLFGDTVDRAAGARQQNQLDLALPTLVSLTQPKRKK